MTDLTFSDSELMAYADGELPEARAAQIDLALAQDTTLADRFALFVDTRASVSKAFTAMLDEPVPDALMQSIRKIARESDTVRAEQEKAENTVVAFRRKSTPPAFNRRPAWQMAIAASLLLAVGLGAGLYLGDTGATGSLQIAGLNDPNITEALSTLPAGERQVLASGSEISIIATFLDDTGAICREFEYDRSDRSTLVSVACFKTHWDVRFVVAAAPSGDTGFAPASSLATLDAYLEAIGAQAPLALAEEAETLARLQRSGG